MRDIARFAAMALAASAAALTLASTSALAETADGTVSRSKCREAGGVTDPWRGGFCHGGFFDGYRLSD
ncbi:hypothetical protein [Nonomuraea sp. NPDC046570]|uniref:hypothetical protein n=1 Tax=Nonomuraea sp. NPDC046570 TaxID=3155255 RepID=UPI0033E00815